MYSSSSSIASDRRIQAAALLTVFFVATLLRPSALAAQEAGPAITFEVVTLTYGNTDRTLQQEASAALRETLIDRGADEAEHPAWSFVVAARPIEEHPELMALSVVALARLSEPVVDWAKEAQIFYIAMSGGEDVSLPEEGAHIREYMSEEYIRQFGMIQEHEILIARRDALRGRLAEFAASFFERHTRP